MTHTKTNTETNNAEHRRRHRPYWIGIVVVAFTLLVLSSGLPASAAPPHQTVPQPTATPEPPPQPTATSTPKPDDDDDDDDNNGDGNDCGNDSSGNDSSGNDSSGVALSPPVEPQEVSVSGALAAVNVSALNVRSGPGTNYGVIGLVEATELLTVLGQNQAGDWWLICCIGSEGTNGWVAARFMTPEFDPAALTLPIIEAPTTTDESNAADEPSSAAKTSDVATAEEEDAPLFALVLSAPQASHAALQGSTVEMEVVLSNPSEETARNVKLRNELPENLSLETADVGAGGEVLEESAANGATILDIRWPELAAGEIVTTTIVLRVAPELSDGITIDNLVAASADNARSASSGIVIGLPPTTLPDFQ